jgi:hypothetical protein
MFILKFEGFSSVTDRTDKKKSKGKGKSKDKTPKTQSIVIDEGRGLVFNSEAEVIDHFQEQIEKLEKEYNEFRRENDTSLDDIENLDEQLTDLLQEPDEVWLSDDVLPEIPLGTFIGYFETEDEKTNFYYVALTYFVENMPKFVFMHFATTDLDVIKKYQRGEKIYDRNNPQVASDEEAIDALTEGDELAVGLYRAMLKLRSATDIPESEFGDYLKFREDTIQEPDEIWRKIDSEGRVLVSFIKNLDDNDVKYIVVTMEDEASESQYLLFSFPTKDSNLVDRYRQGESLDTVSYSREESH